MIQNILTFCVKNDLTFVEGSIPSGKLVANDINRNSIYLVTPYDEAIVKANFQTNLQSDTPTSVLGILVQWVKLLLMKLSLLASLTIT